MHKMCRIFLLESSCNRYFRCKLRWLDSIAQLLVRTEFHIFLTTTNTTLDNFPFSLTCHQWSEPTQEPKEQKFVFGGCKQGKD